MVAGIVKVVIVAAGGIAVVAAAIMVMSWVASGFAAIAHANPLGILGSGTKMVAGLGLVMVAPTAKRPKFVGTIIAAGIVLILWGAIGL